MPAFSAVFARAWVGDWSQLPAWYLRAGWLLGVVAAGAAAYALGLALGGLRPRHLREA